MNCDIDSKFFCSGLNHCIKILVNSFKMAVVNNFCNIKFIVDIHDTIHFNALFKWFSENL